MKKEILEWAVAIGIAVVLIVVIRAFLFVSFTVDGESMDPTLEDGDRVVVNKFIDNFSGYDMDDLIVFNSNIGPAYVKRIIGTEGDTVEMVDKQVYVNGEAVDQDYITHTGDSYLDDFELSELPSGDGDNNSEAVEEIPEGKLLVLGDNRPVSRDSRDFGLIDEDDVIGKVQLRYWPFNEIAVNFD